MKVVLAAALAIAFVSADAQAPDERAWLAEQRQAVTQRFELEEKACLQKFASTGCLADVRARRRDALAPLRARELSLADEDRQQRAQERRRALAAKQQAAADRPPEPMAPVLKLRQATPSARPASAANPPRVTDHAAREAEAAQRAQAQARRQADIDADKKRVADRVAARASEGKPVQPLPPPLPARRASQAKP